MKNPTLANREQLEKILDDFQVDIMVYDPHLDAPWVQIYRDHPDWEIETEDDGIILFSRNSSTSLGA